MLRELRIQNLAVIEEVALVFGPGLNILTGETGAGKSIILGALQLLLGDRADTDVVRTGAPSASVEAVFEYKAGGPVASYLSDCGLDGDADDLIIRREIASGGRSRAFVNGRLATLAQLKSLGELLVDLHGQHQHQSLLSREIHQRLLDDFGGHTKERDAYAHAWSRWQEARARLQSLQTDERERERQKSFLTFQRDEIRAAQLSPKEDEELPRERARLVNAERLQRESLQACDLLYEGEQSEATVLRGLDDAHKLIEGLAALDESLRPLLEPLATARANIEEVAFQLRQYASSLEHDPQRLEEVENRLDLIRNLKKKYGSTIAEILAAGERFAAELEALDRIETDRADAETELQSARAALEKSATALSARRRAAARKLEKLLLGELSDLELGRSRFEVQLQPEPPLSNTDLSPSASGAESVEYFISPNPGEELRPLRKIASGGELSRIMLALKSLFASQDRIPTLVFDEIDVGISGRTATRIGEKLHSLSRSHQILCITHLPQIAARGDIHFLVEKQQEKTSTRTLVSLLEGDARVAVLAQLLDGKELSELSLRHARELLQKS
ncbi:MAG: DNA repair protein RecN [bacterium]